MRLRGAEMIGLKKIKELISESTSRYFSHNGNDASGRPSLMKGVFTDIYHSGAWGDPESVSGPGSSVRRASAFRDEIPKILRDLKARSLLDAPCGDFNWMKDLRLSVERYTGVDIVPEIVERNRVMHAGPGRAFLNLDITKDRLPRADVILCRDCLVHFSRDDIYAAIRNFKKSKSRYLLATTFTGLREYIEISTGEWRPLNFGIRTLREPLSEAALSRELARYDPRDAAEVSRRMRSVASRDAAVDEILALYQEVLEEWAGTSSLDPSARRRAEGRDTASYLRWLAPRIVDNERLTSERDWIQAEYYKLDSRLYALNEEASQLKDQLEKSERLIRTLETEASEQALSLRRELAQVNEENRRLVASGELLQAEISERGRYILRLTTDLSEREQSISRLTTELAAVQERLQTLTGSLGWRMLSLYGPVKHRLLLPAYNRIKKVFGPRPGGDVTRGTRAPRD